MVFGKRNCITSEICFDTRKTQTYLLFSIQVSMKIWRSSWKEYRASKYVFIVFDSLSLFTHMISYPTINSAWLLLMSGIWVYTCWVEIPNTWPIIISGWGDMTYPINNFQSQVTFLSKNIWGCSQVNWTSCLGKYSPSSSLIKICSWSRNDNNWELKAAIPKSQCQTALSNCSLILRVGKHAEEIIWSIIG